MTNEIVKIYKEISAVPQPFEPNSIYFIRVGEGVDIYVSNSTGTAIFKVNTASGENWRLIGNAGIDPAINFIGTTDNQPLAFRVNNIERWKMASPSGFLSYGTGAVAGGFPINLFGTSIPAIGRYANTELESVFDSYSNTTTNGDVEIRLTGNVNADLVPANTWRIRSGGSNPSNIAIGRFNNTPHIFCSMLSGLNVGFNNTNPQFRIDVNGTARISETPLINSAPRMLVKNPTTGQISEQNIPNELLETRTSGLNIFSFVVQNPINIANGVDFNILNNVNGILSTNGTLTRSGDSWDRMNIIDGSFLRPDPYLHTAEPYQSIDTDIYLRLPTAVGGGATSVRTYLIEARRRTPASPTVPLAIPNREIELATSSVSGVASVQSLPTRSVGADDNYYIYGYGLFLRNISGATLNIPAGGVIRLEYYNKYKKPIIFNTLTSPNI